MSVVHPSTPLPLAQVVARALPDCHTVWARVLVALGPALATQRHILAETHEVPAEELTGLWPENHVVRAVHRVAPVLCRAAMAVVLRRAIHALAMHVQRIVNVQVVRGALEACARAWIRTALRFVPEVARLGMALDRRSIQPKHQR